MSTDDSGCASWCAWGGLLGFVGALLGVIIESGIWCPLLALACWAGAIALIICSKYCVVDELVLRSAGGVILLISSCIAAYFSLIKGIGFSSEDNIKSFIIVLLLFIIIFSIVLWIRWMAYEDERKWIENMCRKVELYREKEAHHQEEEAHRQEEEAQQKKREEAERITRKIQEENERRRQESKRRKAEATKTYEQRKKNLETAKAKLADLEKTFRKIVSRRILLDSNIWMNDEYEVLFYELTNALKSANSVIMMPGVQFDEIGNLKNSSDENKKYAARTALRRIEATQQQDILLLQGVKAVASRYAYADPEFIKYVLYEAAELQDCSGSIFVTDDRELRIRINAIVKERLNKDVFVVPGADIKEIAEQIFEIRRIIEHDGRYC